MVELEYLIPLKKKKSYHCDVTIPKFLLVLPHKKIQNGHQSFLSYSIQGTGKKGLNLPDTLKKKKWLSASSPCPNNLYMFQKDRFQKSKIKNQTLVDVKKYVPPRISAPLKVLNLLSARALFRSIIW